MALSGLNFMGRGNNQARVGFTMRGVDRRGTSGVERGGGHSTIVWGDDWNDKKIERKWGLGLKWPKLHGKTQQPAESWRSR
jgi:hypothetical protein